MYPPKGMTADEANIGLNKLINSSLLFALLSNWEPQRGTKLTDVMHAIPW